MRLELPTAEGTSLELWGEARTQHLHYLWPITVCWDLALMWGKTIAMHRIKLRRFSIYFSFRDIVILQFLTIFHLIFLYMEYDFCFPLSRCFVPSASSRMLFCQEP